MSRFSKLKAAASSLGTAVKGAAEDVADVVSETVHDAASTVSEKAHDAASAVKDSLNDIVTPEEEMAILGAAIAHVESEVDGNGSAETFRNLKAAVEAIKDDDAAA